MSAWAATAANPTPPRGWTRWPPPVRASSERACSSVASVTQRALARFAKANSFVADGSRPQKTIIHRGVRVRTWACALRIRNYPTTCPSSPSKTSTTNGSCSTLRASPSTCAGPTTTATARTCRSTCRNATAHSRRGASRCGIATGSGDSTTCRPPSAPPRWTTAACARCAMSAAASSGRLTYGARPNGPPPTLPSSTFPSPPFWKYPSNTWRARACPTSSRANSASRSTGAAATLCGPCATIRTSSATTLRRTRPGTTPTATSTCGSPKSWMRGSRGSRRGRG